VDHLKEVLNMRYDIDPVHTTITFSAKHMLVATVRGSFKKFSGWVEFDPEHPEQAKVEVEIDAFSIDTREEARDNHLRSADFLYVEKYPTITFKAEGARKIGPGQYELPGKLTIRGVTRDVTLQVEGGDEVIKDAYGFIRRGFTARTTINRHDFDLRWDNKIETGGLIVGERVGIEIDVELMAKAEETAAEKTA
jgi:polyisoprenoid-binding protein YceI